MHTFRNTFTLYGSRNESSIRSGSSVYRNRFNRTIARTHSIAYWNFFRALNWLCRRICNFPMTNTQQERKREKGVRHLRWHSKQLVLINIFNN